MAALRFHATLLLPAHQRVRFPFQKIADGDRVSLGSASITAMHTPGHTNESTSYVLNQAAVFTGDTLFTNGVGRPDLHADPEAARQRARALFRSLTHLQQLRPETIVLPAHTREPLALDSQPVAARLGAVTARLPGGRASRPRQGGRAARVVLQGQWPCRRGAGRGAGGAGICRGWRGRGLPGRRR